MSKKMYILVLVLIIAIFNVFVYSVSADNGVIAKAPRRTSSGRIIYSYVDFGTYPQTEVVHEDDEALITALKQRKATYKKVSSKVWSKLINAKYDSNGDTLINGIKYRRIKKSDATNAYDSENTYYWSDDTTYHYFRFEKIKWRVLEVKKGMALLVSEYSLDGVKYNATQNYVMWDIRWKNSSIRSWLNGYKAKRNNVGVNYQKSNFIDTAFIPEQKDSLIPYNTSPGANDKVFLLGLGDVYGSDKAYSHGFPKSATYNQTRMCTCSTYALAKGNYKDMRTGNVWWWLRSANKISDSAPVVEYGGDVNWNGQNNDNDCGGIRPAIMVSRGRLNSLSKVISIVPGSLELKVKQSRKCKISKNGISNIGTVKWISSNKKVVEVTNTGVVKAKSAGAAIVTAKTSKGFVADCKVVVKKSTKNKNSKK